MGKRLMALFIAGVLAGSMAGCGNETDGETENQSSGSSAEKTSEEENGEKNLYGYDDPVTIKVGLSFASDFEFKGDEDAENNAWMDLYRENNIIPEILYNVDASQADTKLSTAIMSGNYPDIIGTTLNDYTGYAKNGVVADITEAYEKYASDELKEYMNADGGTALESLKIDGKLYGLPKVGNSYDSVPLMFIRQDWLENLGLEVPDTMDELMEVAKAFTHEDPDQNGKDDTYGLAIDGVNVFSNTIGDANAVFYAYDAYPGPDSMAFVEGEDGKVTWGGTNTDGMKKGLEFLKELYEDGALAKDFITMDSDSIFEEAGSGRCGIWFGPMWAGMVPQGNAIKADPDAHVASYAIPSGTGEAAKPLIKASIESVYCVSSQCENPEVLIKLMNLSVQKLCHPENDEEFYRYYGDTENYSGWKTALTGTLEPLKNYENYKKEFAALESGDTSELNTEQMSDYSNMKAYLDAKESGTFDPEDAVMSAGIQTYTVFGDPQGAYAALDEMIQADSFTYAVYNTAPTEKMADSQATLSKMAVETVVKIITGQSVDAYDDFLDNWYTMGGEDVISEAQAWADENQ